MAFLLGGSSLIFIDLCFHEEVAAMAGRGAKRNETVMWKGSKQLTEEGRSLSSYLFSLSSFTLKKEC